MCIPQKTTSNIYQYNDSRNIDNSQSNFNKQDVEKSYCRYVFIKESPDFKPHYDKILYSRQLTIAAANSDVSKSSDCLSSNKNNRLANINLPSFDIYDRQKATLKKFKFSEQYPLTLYTGITSCIYAIGYSCFYSFIGLPAIAGLASSIPVLFSAESYYKKNIAALTRYIRLPESIVGTYTPFIYKYDRVAFYSFDEFYKKLHTQFNKFTDELSRGNLSAFTKEKSPLHSFDLPSIFMSLYQTLDSKQEDIPLLISAFCNGIIHAWMDITIIRLLRYKFADDITQQFKEINYIPHTDKILQQIVDHAVLFLSKSQHYKTTTANIPPLNNVTITSSVESVNECVQVVENLADGFYIFSRDSSESYPTRGICRISNSDKLGKVLPKYTYYQPFEEMEISTEAPGFFTRMLMRSAGKNHKNLDFNFHLLEEFNVEL